MTDEKFAFVSDVAEKKRTARGSHNKRTHCGKGGAVRFPSDSLSRREFNAMSGDVKSYRLNDPMKWDEFKAMPDDLKVSYVKSLRNRFHVSDVKIFEMFGISQNSGSRAFRKMGLALGKGSHHGGFLKEEWLKWLNGIKLDRIEDECTDPAPVEENRSFQTDMVEPEKTDTGCPLSIADISHIHRLLSRIEGVSLGCSDPLVRNCLLDAVEQIEAILHLTEGGEENAAD